MNCKLVLPGSTIGILGGGQLGRMMAIEAKRMGYDVICMDPQPNAPCGQVADNQIVAELNDLEAAYKLAKHSDIIVYEFENIDLQVVEMLEKDYYLPQGSQILKITQNRLCEKTSLQKAGFPVADFRHINGLGDLEKGIKELGYPCILKKVTGGYDGKGQLVLNGEECVNKAENWIKTGNCDWVLEKKVSFISEVSVIVARKSTGEMAVYPVSENIHRENILCMTVVPARVQESVQLEAINLAKKVAEVFNVVGLLAVEFFVTSEGILINELAPRPHNSGHYSIDACYVSQFEQLIRAVCGLQLGATDLNFPVVMANVMGSSLQSILRKVPQLPENVKLHLYGKKGKTEAKRKMGHISIKTKSLEEGVNLAKELLELD